MSIVTYKGAGDDYAKMILPQMQQCAKLLIPHIGFIIIGQELKVRADSFAPFIESILKERKSFLPVTDPGPIIILVAHENINGLTPNSVVLNHCFQIWCIDLMERWSVNLEASC